MISNKLSINPNKTEYLLFNPNNVNLPVNIINLGSNTISPRDSAKNLGIIFHTDMSMDKHISSIIKSCFLQLRDFRRFHTVARIVTNSFHFSHITPNSQIFTLASYILSH